ARAVTALEQLNDEAEHHINSACDFAGAVEIYRHRRARQQQFRDAFGLSTDRTVYYPVDWVRNIGHMALLDLGAKERLLNGSSPGRPVLIAPRDGTSNPAYLRYFRPHYQVVTDPHLVTALTPLARALGDRVASLIRLPDGSERYLLEGVGSIQEEWE